MMPMLAAPGFFVPTAMLQAEKIMAHDNTNARSSHLFIDDLLDLELNFQNATLTFDS
jgi:hypothetical protein